MPSSFYGALLFSTLKPQRGLELYFLAGIFAK